MVLSLRKGEELELIDRPDLRERNAPTVDEAWGAQDKLYVVEHTQIEAFPGQVRDDQAFVRLMEPLELTLNGLFTGRFSLSIEVGSATDFRGDPARVREHIAEFFRERAATLVVGEQVETYPTAAMRVRIRRDSLRGERVIVNRFTDLDVSGRRRQRLSITVETKCPKLKRAADGQHADSVLILEQNDVAFGSHIEVAEALEFALLGRDDCPDYVIVVSTVEHPWSLWILREYAARFPEIENIPEAGAHYVEG